jgi:hypothetical protein
MQLDFDIKKTVLASVNSWRSEILDNYNRSGMRASGKFEKGLIVKDLSSDFTIQIQLHGAPHSKFVEGGRNPTNPNAPKGSPTLAEIIKQWAIDKGIQINPFAVARKIHKEGWKPRSLQTIGRPIISSVINSQEVSKLSKDISKDIIVQLSSIITSPWLALSN